jgi:predicted ATPase/serine/threonine protein kinase
MAIASGTKLGPYEILAALGAGGMGEVYRARDTRLDRMVAIKILPEAFSADADRLRRFEQEARAASALNHPNIVTIYERGHVEERGADSGTYYIAMELVEGKTLRELLGQGLPLKSAMEIAAQAADGLAKAHEAGIAHRDLKPENLMVSHDGFVKILDFGLAKVDAAVTKSPEMATATGWQTAPGKVMGTTGYLSPEQARGLAADFRSDQFSFGVVLYEMIVGKRAFHRETAAETLVAILREEPEPIALQGVNAPAPLCWAIERCLAKDPDKRYASTRDLARELAAIRDHLRDHLAEKTRVQESVAAVNLPVQRTGFVGREKEVAAAKELLQRDTVRLVTITGPGGIGKTRLAIEVASQMGDVFSGGAHFIPLSSLSDSGLIASAVVQALGIREAGGQPPLELLRESFQKALSQPMLLVLDNFEHLVAGAPVVAELLAMAPKLKILVTSRAALHVSGEREFPVPPLGMSDSGATLTVEEMGRVPAIALFVQRATAVKPDFDLTRENAAVVAEICARLDGLPLAIELAAARVKVLSPSAMRTRLRSRLQLLTGGARDMPERQQTLRAAIDWSYDLLGVAEQRLFRRLGVFVGGCTLEGAEAVCDARGDLELDVLDGMTSMVDKSLMQQVEPEQGETRFVMLETLREYALEKLEASGEYKETKRAHAAYCLVLAEEDAAEQGGADTAERMQSFALEENNFRAAVEWLTETGDAVWGLRLGAALFHFWETREQHTEGRARLEKLLNLPGAEAPTKARARALFAGGVLANEQGDHERSDALLEESLEIARKLGDKQGAAVSLNALAVGFRTRGDFAPARALVEESLALWREMGDQKAIARAVSNLANILKLQGDLGGARALHAECLAIFEGLGDRTGVAWSLNYQGDIARDQGDQADARRFYERALAIFRELDDAWGIAGTLADLGNLARDLGDQSGARAHYRESIRQFQTLDHKRGIARLLECFASSAAAELEAAGALRLAGTAAALRQSIGAPLTATEQGRLEAVLNPAREALTNSVGVTAWLEGWALPVEKAVEAALGIKENRTDVGESAGAVRG